MGDKVDWSEGRSFPYLYRDKYAHIYPIFTAVVRKSLNMRVLRVGGVVSPQTLAISYSVSDGEDCFQRTFVAFAVDLDPVFLLTRFGERRYRSLEFYTYVSSCQSLLSR